VSSDKELMSRAAATAAQVLAEQWPDDRAIVEIEGVGDLYFLYFLVSARRGGVRVRRTGELMGAPVGRHRPCVASVQAPVRGGLGPGRVASRWIAPTGTSSAAPCTGLRARSRGCAAV
jgi:hypothetical protein